MSEQLRIHISTNQLNESGLAPKYFPQSEAGASIGGAAFRVNDERKAIPRLWPQLLPDIKQTFSHVTIEPIIGSQQAPQYKKHVADIDPLTQFVLAESPKPNQDGVLTYEMIQKQLLQNERFIDEVRKIFEGVSDLFINSNHFYITERIIQEILAASSGPLDRFVSVTRFHSLPSLALRNLYMQRHDLSQEEGNKFLHEIGITDERIRAEIDVLASGLSIYSTQWERKQTAQSYDGVQLPNGLSLSAKEVCDNGIVVPLSYDPSTYYPDNTGELMKKQREQFFPNWDIPQDARFVAVVGRKDPERGYHNATRIAAQYLVDGSTRYGIRPNLLEYFGFIGGVPNKSKSMQKTYEQTMQFLANFNRDHPDLAPHIKMLPKTDHCNISHIADVEMQLPDAESWGLHVLQAMACGKPVIASDLPTYQEWAGDALTYVDPQNSQDVMDALLAHRSPDCSHQQGLKALKQAQRYTHDRSLSAMLAQILYKTNLCV